ncbi:hypothetical protein L226DRAFT_559572 [Lentinus tigrinus ALCF2SS1-7]|uniref:Uncharacterized protein n=1 Tax=Lentinus tigrinus ALCF2SS1-6 TaxID=1328759 RepID=A0A5C2SKP2_9APHY|nr:hypothetical protein L227DRAFT_598662 [Lentinus tigrinus ALCF2SS1-6]RPD76573.1 hypothetical protein L226DRAFT_559572 [Lentinus tigrinus ALCF2SS1-7]
MSSGAVRSTHNRRHTRHNNASPYARPGAKLATNKKPSGWSLTGLLNYLNPFSSHSDEVSAPPEGDAAARLAARGHALEHEELSEFSRQAQKTHPEQEQGQSQPLQPPPPPAPTTSQSTSPPMNSDHRTSPRSDDSQAEANLKKVQQFLDEKGGRPLNHVELAGLVHLLQASVEDEDEQPEPFRFSKSPSTPLRGNTPTINFMSPSTSEQMVSAAGTAAQGARKTLARNPMGVYRWQGGGSARPRNRYQSPSFGSAPSRSTIKLAPEKPKADSKRRRVGEDASTSSPQRAGATAGAKVNGSAPSTLPNSVSAPAALSSPATNGRPNGAPIPAPPSTPRIRTSGIKPTTPAIPSPLRQTWGNSDSPPQPSPPQPASKPTRAASFMTELIKGVTPPKKPDFANPYEAANPMIKPAPKRHPVRKTRTTAKAEAEAKKKESELTPQAIIEATVPKGSKRSRPPPELIGVKSPERKVTSPESTAPRRSTRLNGTEPRVNGVNGASKTRSVTVEEVSDEDQPSPTKKARTAKPPPPQTRIPTVTVEEVDDVEMSSAPSSKSASSTTYTLPSEIIEPGDDKLEKKRSTSPTPTFAMGNGSSSSRSSFPINNCRSRLLVLVQAP